MIAKMLNPSCVCLESSGQHNISTSAPSGHGKVVKFERVFPGVFLHHLFMHMTLFSPPLALHSLDRSKWCFRGFGKYSGTDGMDRSSGSLMPVQTAPCYEWRMARGRGFESWNSSFTVFCLFFRNCQKNRSNSMAIVDNKIY